MRRLLAALLVVILAILFYSPTFVRIPSSDEVGEAAPSGAATSAAPTQTSSTQSAVPSAPSPVELPDATGRKVIVVGGGLAGMCATIEAIRAGAHVHIVEKMPRLGGNSEKASSGMNAAETAAQAKLAVADSVEDFYKDTIASGHGLSVPSLVEVLTKQSASAFDFLTTFDIDLSAVTKLGGHSHARTHRPHHTKEGIAKNVGWEITSTLSKYLQRIPSERLTITTEARLTSLIVEGDKVVGIKYLQNTKTDDGAMQGEQKESCADAVVLTTGGYARAQDLLGKYTPHIVSLATTNGPFAEGDGIKVAEAINASVIHMDQVQIHPTSFVMPKDPLAKTKFLAPEALRGLGGILLNHEGRRFVNELETRDRVTDAIFKNCHPMRVPLESDPGKTVEGPVMAHLVMIDEAVKEFPPLKFYSSKGFVTKYHNIHELATGLKVPEDNLKETLAAYNQCYDSKGQCNDPWGKKDFPYPTRENDVYHVMMITPAIHYTMGGLEIDHEAHVLRNVSTQAQDHALGSTPEFRETIPGLFAAGEVTGGVHGGNRLAGNSLLECVVFGRIAGQTAAVPEAKASDDS